MTQASKSLPEDRLASPQDRRFLERWTGGLFGPGEFRHADHVQLAWIYLTLYQLPFALHHLSLELKDLAVRNGAPEIYNETITWAFALLINRRMASSRPCGTFADFARRNPDLMTSGKALLDAYYRPQTLASEEARRIFVLPDRPVSAEERRTA